MGWARVGLPIPTPNLFLICRLLISDETGSLYVAHLHLCNLPASFLHHLSKLHTAAIQNWANWADMGIILITAPPPPFPAFLPLLPAAIENWADMGIVLITASPLSRLPPPPARSHPELGRHGHPARHPIYQRNSGLVSVYKGGGPGGCSPAGAG